MTFDHSTMYILTGAETIQERKLFKGGNYSRKYGISKNVISKKVSFSNKSHLVTCLVYKQNPNGNVLNINKTSFGNS